MSGPLRQGVQGLRIAAGRRPAGGGAVSCDVPLRHTVPRDRRALVELDRADPAAGQPGPAHLRGHHGRRDRASGAGAVAHRRDRGRDHGRGRPMSRSPAASWSGAGSCSGSTPASSPDPTRRPCAPGSSAPSRFVQAVGASVYHELFALLGAVALFVLTYGQPNRVALWTYVILWVMHSSAKLNMFLGVPNLGAEMLPDHLAFLTSFMARKPHERALSRCRSPPGRRSRRCCSFGRAARGRAAFEIAGFADARVADGARRRRALVPGRSGGRQRAVEGVPAQCGGRPAGDRDAGRAGARGAHDAAPVPGEGARVLAAWRADPPHVCDSAEHRAPARMRSRPDASARSMRCRAWSGPRRTGSASS